MYNLQNTQNLLNQTIFHFCWHHLSLESLRFNPALLQQQFNRLPCLQSFLLQFHLHDTARIIFLNSFSLSFLCLRSSSGSFSMIRFKVTLLRLDIIALHLLFPSSQYGPVLWSLKSGWIHIFTNCVLPARMSTPFCFKSIQQRTTMSPVSCPGVIPSLSAASLRGNIYLQCS